MFVFWHRLAGGQAADLYQLGTKNDFAKVALKTFELVEVVVDASGTASLIATASGAAGIALDELKWMLKQYQHSSWPCSCWSYS